MHPSIPQRPASLQKIANADGLFGFFYRANANTIRRAALVAAITWIPAFMLVAARGWDSTQSFLTDLAAQSRLLVVAPLLILAEPDMVCQLTLIAHQFVTADLLPPDNLARFEAALARFHRQCGSRATSILIFLFVYSVVVTGIPYLRDGLFPSWWHQPTAPEGLTPAGFWYFFVGLPFMTYLLLVWIWQQSQWTLFLRTVARLNPRLVPAHPDLSGGLGFLQTSLRTHIPFAFSLGAITAGAVGNQVVLFHQPPQSFRHYFLAVVVVVVVVCVGPLCIFTRVLLDARTGGVFRYGSLATALGLQFEAKWLPERSETTSSMLEAPDFSAAIDLYSVAANVRKMRVLPVGLKPILSLVAVTLVPALPIALLAIPLDVLIKDLLKVLA